MKKNILPFFLLIFLGFSSESPCLQQPIKTQNKKFFLGLLPDNASHKWIKSVLKESLEEILEEDKSNQCHLLSQLFLTLWANENRYHVTVLNEKLFLDTSQPKIRTHLHSFR